MYGYRHHGAEEPLVEKQIRFSPNANAYKGLLNVLCSATFAAEQLSGLDTRKYFTAEAMLCSIYICAPFYLRKDLAVLHCNGPQAQGLAPAGYIHADELLHQADCWTLHSCPHDWLGGLELQRAGGRGIPC